MSFHGGKTNNFQNELQSSTSKKRWKRVLFSVSTILSSSTWKHANMLTRNGCLMEFATSNIRFSASRDSTSSRTMMSPFFKALMAKYSPVLRYLAKITWKTTVSHVSLGQDMGGSFDTVFLFFFWSVYLPEVAPSENGAKVERVDSHGWVRAKHRRCSHRSGKKAWTKLVQWIVSLSWQRVHSTAAVGSIERVILWVRIIRRLDLRRV